MSRFGRRTESQSTKMIFFAWFPFIGCAESNSISKQLQIYLPTRICFKLDWISMWIRISGWQLDFVWDLHSARKLYCFWIFLSLCRRWDWICVCEQTKRVARLVRVARAAELRKRGRVRTQIDHQSRRTNCNSSDNRKLKLSSVKVVIKLELPNFCRNSSSLVNKLLSSFENNEFNRNDRLSCALSVRLSAQKFPLADPLPASGLSS